MPPYLLPTFIDPPHAPLIGRLLTSFPGKDLVSHRSAWPASGSPGIRCARLHCGQPPGVPAGPSPGPGKRRWLAGARRGRPAARSRRSSRRIEALNYLTREREAAATATPRFGARRHARTPAPPRGPDGAAGHSLPGCRLGAPMWGPSPPPGAVGASSTGHPTPPQRLSVPRCPQVVPPPLPALSPTAHRSTQPAPRRWPRPHRSPAAAAGGGIARFHRDSHRTSARRRAVAAPAPPASLFTSDALLKRPRAIARGRRDGGRRIKPDEYFRP